MASPQTDDLHHGTPGWFGKLASLGDFAQRRVPAHWVNVCDPWLSASMRAGDELLQEHWIPVYRTAPVLRFAWAPGVVDSLWWFGLLMPSCDNVGRYFPLLITQPRARPPEDRIALDHLEIWFDHLARAALQTLSNAGGSVTELEDALHDAPPWPTPGHNALLKPQDAAPTESWLVGRQVPLSAWLPSLAAGGLTRRLAGHSLWWRSDPSSAHGAVDLVPGLPVGAQFVALFQRDG
jgi:type VI secretion system protein ImpM